MEADIPSTLLTVGGEIPSIPPVAPPMTQQVSIKNTCNKVHAVASYSNFSKSLFILQTLITYYCVIYHDCYLKLQTHTNHNNHTVTAAGQ